MLMTMKDSVFAKIEIEFSKKYFENVLCFAELKKDIRNYYILLFISC
jgi:hypothetical protein